jgi:predicted nuclease with RNAse H fold
VDSVIGVDLSGISRATKGRTAAAQLSVTDPPRLLDLRVFPYAKRPDVALLAWISEHESRVVAIDAPLSLPHSVTCTEAGCLRCRPEGPNYLQRDVDARAKGMSMVMIAAVAFRGMYLARQLERGGIQVIETYPAAAYRALGATARGERQAVLERRVGPFTANSEDERDAVCAGFVAVDYTRGVAGSFRGKDGEIWLPQG